MIFNELETNETFTFAKKKIDTDQLKLTRKNGINTYVLKSLLSLIYWSSLF